MTHFDRPFPVRRIRLIRRVCGASALAIVVAVGTGPLTYGAAQAQNAPGGFSLPEPTPTPTPAPQGPVDVRSGVPIAPRSIPTEAPAPTPSATPVPNDAATTEPLGEPELETAVERDSASPPASSAPALIGPAARPVQPARQGGAPSAQGFEASPPGAPAPAVPQDSSSSENAGQASPIAAPPPAASAGDAIPDAASETAQQSGGFPLWLRALIALGLGVAAAIAAWFLRTRKSAARQPAPTAAPRVTDPPLDPKTQQPQTRAITPPPAKSPAKSPAAPAAPAPPPRIDLELEIAGATRSLMMFTLDCRLTLVNRSDNAVRDIAVSGALVCAQRSATAPATGSAANALETLDRIGPNQSRTITAQLTLPLSEIQPLRQGQKPLFIPLAQITLAHAGSPDETRSFVIGTPSMASTGRLHPIALDTPPGSVPGLLARQVKADGAAAKAA